MGLDERTAAAAAAHAGLSLAPGQKVLDNLTAFTGVVVDGKTAHRVITETAGRPASAEPGLFKVPEVQLVESYTVKLTNGAVVTRELDELLKLPANVSADLEDFA